MKTRLQSILGSWDNRQSHSNPKLPIQAGDDTVLENMKRGYTQNEYRDLVAKIRDRIPECSIATDIIVGFPGETEEQFMQTHRVLSDLKLDVAHLARYLVR